jgi:hypothetical protein
MSPMDAIAGLEALKQRIQALGQLPSEVINLANKHIMAEVPVYTGAYQSAIQTEFAENQAAIYISEAALVAAQVTGGMKPERAVLDIYGTGPSGPYPLRIEAHGGPSSGAGLNMWLEASEIVQQAIEAKLKEFSV